MASSLLNTRLRALVRVTVFSFLLLVGSALVSGTLLSSSGITYSQLALGGGYECILLISNHSNTTWRGTVSLRQSDDVAWSAHWSLDGVNKSNSSEFALELGPGCSQKHVIGGDAQVRAGYLRIDATEGSPQSISVSMFYNFIQAGGLMDSTATPSGSASRKYWVTVEKSTSINTGFAWVGTGEANGSFKIHLALCNAAGQVIQYRTQLYEGHSSRFFAGPDGIFQGVPDGFVGGVIVDSEQDIFLTVLRLESTAGGFQLTSIPPTASFQIMEVATGAWAGEGLEFTVSETGAMQDLEFAYDGSDGCSRCLINVDYLVPTFGGNEIRLQSPNSGFTMSGSFTDPTHWSGQISVASTNCRLTDRSVSAVYGSADTWNSFEAPGISPTGLAFDGTYLWHADSSLTRIYQLDVSGNVITSFQSPGLLPTGLAFDGTYLWSASYYGGGQIYKLTLSGEVLDSFDAPGEGPQGLAFDGTYLWISDHYQKKIYKVSKTGTVITSFDAPGNDPNGLVFDGTYLWHADSSSDKIYKLSLTGTILDTLDAPGGWPTGLAFDGVYLWAASQTTGRIYRIAVP